MLRIWCWERACGASYIGSGSQAQASNRPVEGRIYRHPVDISRIIGFSLQRSFKNIVRKHLFAIGIWRRKTASNSVQKQFWFRTQASYNRGTAINHISFNCDFDVRARDYRQRLETNKNYS